MFRRSPDAPWDEPIPPGRAVALAFAGLAATATLVVGVIMAAGTTGTQAGERAPGVAPAGVGAGVVMSAPERVGNANPAGPAPTVPPLSPIPLPSTTMTTAATTTVAATTVPAVPAPIWTAPAPSSVTAPTTAPPTTAPPGQASSTTTTTRAPTTTLPTSTTSTTTVTTTATATTTTIAPTTSTTSTTSLAPAPTLWRVLQSEPDLSRFADLVDQGGMAASIEVDEGRTLLAPDDAAITAYAATAEGAAELATPETIRAFVLRHLVLRSIGSEALWALPDVDTASGAVLPVDAAAGTVGGAELARTDVVASNGVLHVATAIVVSG